MSVSENRSIEEQSVNKKPFPKRIILISSISAVLVIAIVVFGILAANYGQIFGGVTVCSTDVGQMSVEEATVALEDAFSDKAPQITIKIKDRDLLLSFADIGEYDYATTAEKAYNNGKSNIFTKFYYYITPFVSKDTTMEFYLDEEKTLKLIEDEHSKLEDHYNPTTYEIQDDVLVITTGNAGYAVDTQNIIDQIKKGISKCEDVSIEATIVYKEFDGVNITKIHNEVCGEPENARYDEENGTIIPHKNGYKFNVEEARKVVATATPNTSYSINLEVTYPEITEATLTGKMFEDVLATYTTKYNPNEINRTHNMVLAGNKVNDTVLAPGQVFSYNGVVGERTVAKGYRNAKVFENGRVVDGLAGGICQVSTTIYNAALYSNMEIVERKNHMFPVSYAPKGQDATVVMGSIDFKFKNSTSNPIKLTCSIANGNCTVTILGIKEKHYTVEINNVITGTTPFKTEYENDETLEPGKEVVKQSGSNGYSVKSTRTVYENGNVVKTETLPSSYYTPQTKIIARNESAVENTGEENSEGEVPSEETLTPGDIESSPSKTESETLPEAETEPVAPELNLETEIYL